MINEAISEAIVSKLASVYGGSVLQLYESCNLIVNQFVLESSEILIAELLI